jgi:hypothetical protein
MNNQAAGKSKPKPTNPRKTGPTAAPEKLQQIKTVNLFSLLDIRKNQEV